MSESEVNKKVSYMISYRLQNGDVLYFNEEKGLVESKEDATKYSSREELAKAAARLIRPQMLKKEEKSIAENSSKNAKSLKH